VDFDSVRRVLAAFEAEGVRDVIFGAAALNMLGLARATVTPAQLHEMKKGTVRPKDWGDAAALRRRFGLAGD
jgi:hypothetical protein